MGTTLKYLCFYYKLAFRTRDRIKAPGYILLGKLGDMIYKSPLVIIIYTIASGFILLVPAGYSVEVLPTDHFLGLNFILVVPFFLITQILFDWFGLNKQLSSYQELFVINSLSVNERVKMIFLTEFFGFKFIALILCLIIILILNILYLEILNYSLIILVLFFTSLFILYNSVLISLYKYMRRLGDKFFIILLICVFIGSIIVGSVMSNNIESSGVSFIVRVFDYLASNKYLVFGLFAFSIFTFVLSILINRQTLKNLWQS